MMVEDVKEIAAAVSFIVNSVKLFDSNGIPCTSFDRAEDGSTNPGPHLFPETITESFRACARF